MHVHSKLIQQIGPQKFQINYGVWLNSHLYLTNDQNTSY